jgi:hypothetical protein
MTTSVTKFDDGTTVVVDFNLAGNSRAAIAGRAARAVRRANRWKVSAGLITRHELRRWAQLVRKEAGENPARFTHWVGVVRKHPR